MSDYYHRALGLALECLLEALKTINNNISIQSKLEQLINNDQEAQDKVTAIMDSKAEMSAAVTDVSAYMAEAQGEIVSRLAELQATIDQLTAAAPGLSVELQTLIDSAAVQAASVSDSLVQVQAASQALADIVPNAPVEEPVV
jgi:phage-related minor tail protein